MAIHNILVVDDSKTELMYMSTLLKGQGYTVRTAENGDEAVRLMQELVPDLILMDVIMPGVNGFQLTRTIKRNPAYAGVPVIMCTSKDQPTDRVWGLRQGASDYLVKPVSPDELMTKIGALN